MTFPPLLICCQTNNDYFGHLSQQAVEHENGQQILSQFGKSRFVMGSGFTVFESGHRDVTKIPSDL